MKRILAVVMMGLAPLAQARDMPTCECESQCSAMWSEALRAIQSYSGMRLRITSDDFAETFVPRVGLVGTASRQPMGDGRFAIVGTLSPRPSSAQDMANEGMALIDQRLASVAAREACGSSGGATSK